MNAVFMAVFLKTSLGPALLSHVDFLQHQLACLCTLQGPIFLKGFGEKLLPPAVENTFANQCN